MLYNALPTGKKTPKLPLPLGFHNTAGGGPSYSHRQHAQKMVKIARVVPKISRSVCLSVERQTDNDCKTHRHAYHNTSPPLPQVK